MNRCAFAAALANERVQTNAGGQVVRKLKTPWHDGATHLLMSLLEFMQRLAALAPRPRLHLIRFGVGITSPREMSGPPLSEHGVLAPSAKLRAMVVPQEAEAPAQEAKPAECEANCARHRQGTPEQVVAAGSHTGVALAPVLARQ